jgi:hypothetical protein
MKNLIVQSAVMSRFSNKQVVVSGLTSGNSTSGAIISSDFKELIKDLFKVESVHVYIVRDSNQIQVSRQNETLMVGVPVGITKDKLIAQISEYLMNNKRSLLFRVVRFLGKLLKFTKLSKYADAIVGVVEVVIDLFIFKERDNSSSIGFKNHSSGSALDSVPHVSVVDCDPNHFVGKFSSPICVTDYDKPISSVRRLQTFKTFNHV